MLEFQFYNNLPALIFIFILTQGVASGEVYTQLLAVYLFQNDM